MRTRREVLDDVGWKHVLQLAEERSRAPERDAEVVQELGVEVRAQARLVGGQDSDDRAVDLPGAGFGAHVRREVDSSDGPPRARRRRHAEG